MPKTNLVIVESPAKATTVGKYLQGLRRGTRFNVLASIGHVRDLPENRLGVDIEHNYAPRYVIPEKKKDVVKRLRETAKTADAIYLATDPDREGEAISWHLLSALNVKDKPVHRVQFNEITKQAVADAFEHPRGIDIDLVNSQQARRILDRLVGYTLSPLLRRKMSKKGLSAGRVQSVALRLIVDREREIRAFVPEEYWTLDADLAKRPESGKRRPKKYEFRAQLVQIRGEPVERKRGDKTEWLLRDESRAAEIVEDLAGASYKVLAVRPREVQRHPSAPFTTSTLQQEASRKLGFTAKRTMSAAQQLYEGLSVGKEGSVGLITYMRTDSTNVSKLAQDEAREYIAGKFGADYVPASPRVYRTRAKGAQEAHEAIRPTSVLREPDAIKPSLNPDQYKLYRLIWQRFVASQMASAILDTTSVDIGAGKSDADRPYLFRATGSVIRFPGFISVYTEGRDDGAVDDDGKPPLPPLNEGEEVDLLQLRPEQHFTQPPPRYTEATLVKALEEHGIGRPSTYAPIVSTIQDRGYAVRVDKKLQPTELGEVVNDLLVKHFPEIVDVGFTAEMEEELDDIAQGERDWVKVLDEFYRPFESDLKRADREMEEVELRPEPAGIDCEQCGRPMVIKRGRFGKFIACPGFPSCRNTKPFLIEVGVDCPRCGKPIVEKRSRKGGRVFYGCSGYPECDFSTWNRPVPRKCPSCGGLMTLTGRRGLRCVEEGCGHTETMREDELAEAAVG